MRFWDTQVEEAPVLNAADPAGQPAPNVHFEERNHVS